MNFGIDLGPLTTDGQGQDCWDPTVTFGDYKLVLKMMRQYPYDEKRGFGVTQEQAQRAAEFELALYVGRALYAAQHFHLRNGNEEE